MPGPPSNFVGCTACVTRSLCVFFPLAPDFLDGVVCYIRISPKDAIFRQGAPALGWHILCQGCAKLVLHTAKGKRLILRFAKTGDILNLAVFGLHSFSAEALDHCCVGFVERAQIFLLLQKHPELLEEAFRRLSLQVERFARRLEDLRALGVRERLVQVLLELGEEHGIQEKDGLRINLPLSLQDVAEMIGASPQTTSEELHTLVRRGLVNVAWPTLLILAPDALRKSR